ncbi:hypothetical protein F4820DRAFT_333581 [Hypoxylon rubiginosum]|uniref:Uncharacterized protein n=1 Tax=Hypoxylon rubiginosum TaxID=110542 RepID=A0ACB9YZS6_9PEZI|nr:hypothetical protein F4820DRAFT_333581 [Hypoxylon rubiginosum]
MVAAFGIVWLLGWRLLMRGSWIFSTPTMPLPTDFKTSDALLAKRTADHKTKNRQLRQFQKVRILLNTVVLAPYLPCNYRAMAL